MNHKNRRQLAGILRENASPKNLSSSQYERGAIEWPTHVMATEGTLLRRVCLLSRLSLEKQAIAGMSMATKDSTTQKAERSVSSVVEPSSSGDQSVASTHSSAPNPHHWRGPLTPTGAED
jgi:hypothetical protein